MYPWILQMHRIDFVMSFLLFLIFFQISLKFISTTIGVISAQVWKSLGTFGFIILYIKENWSITWSESSLAFRWSLLVYSQFLVLLSQLIEMEGGLDADSPLDYANIQVFMTQNRWDCFSVNFSWLFSKKRIDDTPVLYHCRRKKLVASKYLV